MTKRAIVAEPRRAAHASVAIREPGPLEGAVFEIGVASALQLPRAGPPEIAFAGRSNAGKSSALNALARRARLAHTSRTPGRTRQLNFFRLRNGGLATDLPGYGYAEVPQAVKRGWQELLWSYLTTRATLIGLVLIVDARRGSSAQDEALLAGFLQSSRPVLLLATKVDKLDAASRRRVLAALRARLQEVLDDRARAVTAVAFSAVTREGVDEANATLARWYGGRSSPSAAVANSGDTSRPRRAQKKRPRDQGE